MVLRWRGWLGCGLLVGELVRVGQGNMSSAGNCGFLLFARLSLEGRGGRVGNLTPGLIGMGKGTL